MPDNPERLERRLADDLATLHDRLLDEEFATELYQGLTNVAWWRAEADPQDRVALSWSRAERVVNDLRATVDRPSLTLAQAGGEGEVSRAVDEELGRLGWRHGPLDTGEHDERHVGQTAESQPPPGDGIRHAPPRAQTEEQRFQPAHETADANRQRRP